MKFKDISVTHYTSCNETGYPEASFCTLVHGTVNGKEVQAVFDRVDLTCIHDNDQPFIIEYSGLYPLDSPRIPWETA